MYVIRAVERKRRRYRARPVENGNAPILAIIACIMDERGGALGTGRENPGKVPGKSAKANLYQVRGHLLDVSASPPGQAAESSVDGDSSTPSSDESFFNVSTSKL